ncbi:MAG: FG-GAP-like repeat-containing protein [bacterium]
MQKFYSCCKVAIMLALFGSVPNIGGQTFTRVTTGEIVNDVADSWGAAWGDYNDDGFLDLYVSVNGNDLLYTGNGDTTFTKVTTGAIVTDGGDSRGISWGDYDNDGNLDLFVSNNASGKFLYRNDGPASNYTFTKITSGAIVSDVAGGRGSSWGDYDNDGLLDLFVATNANDLLYHNTGAGTIARIDTGALVTSGGFSIGPAWCDYDNDGDLDLYVANFGENNFFYQNNGNGSFTRITSEIIVNEGGSSVGTSWGDYDNDGDFDLFVTNIANEQNFLYYNDGFPLYTFNKVTAGAMVTDAGIAYGSNWVDYDNDGDLDLHVAYAGTIGNLRHLSFASSGASNYGWAGSVSGGIASFFASTTRIEEAKSEQPQGFVLMQNYPNPFNPATTIRFALSRRERVSLQVFDVRGREVATLVDEEVLAAGEHVRLWEARNHASGIYFYRITTANFQTTRKMMFMQ